MEIGTRQILHCNLTSHATAAWTVQQFREEMPTDHHYQFLIHDRDAIFSGDLDRELHAFGLKVLRTPVQAPKANAYCNTSHSLLFLARRFFMQPLSLDELAWLVGRRV